MGSYTGTIQFRDAQLGSRASVALAHNNLHAAIIGSGMTQVSGADFAGQAGTFVTTTPGSGETEVIIPSSNLAEYTDGFKLYKHPTLALWVKVNFNNLYYSGSTRFVTYNFTFSTELSGGVLTPGKTSPAIIPFPNIFTAGNTAGAMLNTTFNLYVNCGTDNFWIHAPGSLVIAQAANNYTPIGLGTQLSIGIFEKDGTYGVLSAVPYVGQSASNYGPSLTGSQGPQGTRYWQYDGSSWSVAQMCSFGQLDDPATTTSSGSTRVARASKVLGGVRRVFKFGFLSGSIAVENDTISVDLDGAGAKNYKVCVSLGPSSAMSYSYTTAQYSVPFLPWGH